MDIIRHFVFIFVATVLNFPGLTQSIVGKVYDSASRQPLPLATVHVLKKEGTPVSTALSDSLGSFVCRLDTGTYLFVYTSVGYTPHESSRKLTGIDTPGILPPVYLVRDATQLTGVTVVSRRPVIEPLADGFVYNPANDMVMAAGSALDVLRKIPMVSIGQDGNPSVRGSTNIRVFIDNKPSSVYAATLADALQLLSSEDIARIEIITHPSAKYDAEGTDAVINIITKKKKYNGFNGQLRAIAGNWWQELSTSLKMRTGYWITNVEAGLNRSRNENGYSLSRSSQQHETANRLLQQREATSKQQVQYTSLNIIRIIDSLHSISGGYRFRNFRSAESVLQSTQVIAMDTIAADFIRDIPGQYTNGVHTLTATYAGQSPNKKKELNLLAAAFHHIGTDAYHLRQYRHGEVDYQETSNGNTTNRDLMLQADFTHHFNALSKLESGIKTNWRKSFAESNIAIYSIAQGKFLRDDIRSNRFDYTRGIHAVYANYSFAFTEWQFRGGLRFELTRLQARFKDTALRVPGFSNLLPNLLVKRQLAVQNSLSYAYNPRINRPYLYVLNPNINYVDSLNITYGNPRLDPEVWHNHTLDYYYHFRSLFTTVSLQYTKRSRGIEEVRFLRRDKIAETTYRNIGRAQTWGLSASIRHTSAAFNIGSTVVVRYLSLTSPALDLKNSGFQGTIDLNISYRFKGGYSIESFVYAESGSVALQLKRDWYLFYNLVLTRKMLSEKLDITFRADGFLKPWFYRTSTVHSASLYQVTDYRSINRYFRLSLSYKFGKKDIRMPAPSNINMD